MRRMILTAALMLAGVPAFLGTAQGDLECWGTTFRDLDRTLLDIKSGSLTDADPIDYYHVHLDEGETLQATFDADDVTFNHIRFDSTVSCASDWQWGFFCNCFTTLLIDADEDGDYALYVAKVSGAPDTDYKMTYSVVPTDAL